MSRLYKMPVILAFFRNREFTLHVTDENIAESFRKFYSKDGNRVDLEVSKSRKPPEVMTNADWIKLAKENPIRFLTKTEKRFFRPMSLVWTSETTLEMLVRFLTLRDMCSMQWNTGRCCSRKYVTQR